MDISTIISIIAPSVALIVSFIALIISFLSYSLKLSIKISGTYCLTSSSQSNDKYISTVILENNKDKAVSIFGIYFYIKPNYYIELITYDDNPLILGPFATHQEDFGPIQYYYMSSYKVNLNKIFGLKKIHKISCIVVSTSIGKYKVKTKIKRWIPIGEIFKNYFTGWIIPYTIKFNNRFIGSNIKFVVIYKINEKEQAIFLQEDDYMLVKYKNIQFTKESLQSRENLTEFIETVISEGKLKCDSFRIMTPDDWKDNYDFETIDAPRLNWFQYYILGRIKTIQSDIGRKRKRVEKVPTKGVKKVN